MKKFFIVSLTLTVVFSIISNLTFTTTAQTTYETQKITVAGDLSGDDSLDIVDVVIARGYIVGTKDLSEIQITIGDMNDDEVVDIVDIVIMRKTIVGFPLDEELPQDSDTQTEINTETETDTEFEVINQNNEFVNNGYYIWDSTRQLIDNATLSPHYDFNVYLGSKSEENLYQHIVLNENDIATLKAFESEHFCDQNTVSEKMYVTHQWIHYNNDYAYAGEKWNTIEGKTYVDAIFNYKLGQCIQYNGAMAAMLAYYGFDVWMEGVIGVHWTTYVEIDGRVYHIECGNYGKNGEWQDFFTQDLDLT